MADFISKIDSDWTLFLDRDGVINKRIFGGYIKTWQEFEFLEGVTEALVMFSKVFKRIIIVTNQQGVGKGIMSKTTVEEIHKQLVESVKQAGGRIDAIYYCPELANTEGNCRKPGTTMAEMAKSDFPDIDFSKSLMVGDTASDILFGKNAGMKTVLHHSDESVQIDADLKIESLLELAEKLIIEPK